MAALLGYQALAESRGHRVVITVTEESHRLEHNSPVLRGKITGRSHWLIG
jgi:hypothetical protein